MTATTPTRCRCGHARLFHHPTRNAQAKARRLGGRRRVQDGCRWQAGMSWMPKVCPCRDWHPATTSTEA